MDHLWQFCMLVLVCRPSFVDMTSDYFCQVKLYNIQNLLKCFIRFQITTNRSKQIYKRCLLASIVTLDALCKDESVADVYVHKREGDLHLRFCNLSASSGYTSENTNKISNQLPGSPSRQSKTWGRHQRFCAENDQCNFNHLYRFYISEITFILNINIATRVYYNSTRGEFVISWMSEVQRRLITRVILSDISFVAVVLRVNRLFANNWQVSNSEKVINLQMCPRTFIGQFWWLISPVN